MCGERHLKVSEEILQPHAPGITLLGDLRRCKNLRYPGPSCLTCCLGTMKTELRVITLIPKGYSKPSLNGRSVNDVDLVGVLHSGFEGLELKAFGMDFC